MAHLHGLYMGVILTTYWDDPPSRNYQNAVKSPYRSTIWEIGNPLQNDPESRFFSWKKRCFNWNCACFFGGAKVWTLVWKVPPETFRNLGGGWWNMRILHPRWSLNLISNRLLPPKNSLRIDTSQKESPFWSFWEIHGNWFQPLVFGGCKTIRSVKQKTLPLYWHVIPTPPLHIYTPED